MNESFLMPFLALCISFSWSACAKGLSDKNFDYIAFYDTPIFVFIQMALLVCIIIGVIIAGVNLGFLIGLAYLGSAIGVIVLNQLVFAHLLLAIFSYEGIGAVVPIISGIISAIWMFCNTGTF